MPTKTRMLSRAAESEHTAQRPQMGADPEIHRGCESSKGSRSQLLQDIQMSFLLLAAAATNPETWVK